MTEQVVKESVSGAHTDAAFGFSEKEDGESASEWYIYSNNPVEASVSSVSDSGRRSNVIYCDGTSTKGGFMIGDYWDTNPNDAEWNDTRRVLSFWYKGNFPSLEVYVTSSAGKHRVTYHCAAGDNGYNGNGWVHIYLGTGAGSTGWKRFERDVKADYEAYATGKTWQSTNGLYFWAGSTLNYDLYLDDIRLSNCRTVEYNALTGGSTGQIAAQYTFSGSYPTYTVRWYHYDRLGNVMNLTDTGANVVASYDQDAYGNMISNMTTGQWASSISGRHLTTKEADADAGLYYFYQRWYEPEVGRFTSPSEFPIIYEQSYSYAMNNSTSYVDLDGRVPTVGGIILIGTLGGCLGAAAKDIVEMMKSPVELTPEEQLAHVICSCASGGIGGAITSILIIIGNGKLPPTKDIETLVRILSPAGGGAARGAFPMDCCVENVAESLKNVPTNGGAPWPSLGLPYPHL